ncbi:patatin-like phospholipase family protein [candidate division KSB1 bacterium]|nr:patatin-like phospholipase family protein [candidate division KSB1 bacterium]
MTTPRIGLTLGGGGARGLSHIAFLKALDEMNLKPSVISGTSIGAIIGSFYAAGISATDMEAMLASIHFKEITRFFDLSLLKGTAMFKGDAIEDFLIEHIPARHFDQLKIPIKIIATDFWKRKEVVLDSGDLIWAVRASMSIPLVFEPVTIGDMVLVDGGLVNPLPYDHIRKECDLLVAIDVTGQRVPTHDDPVPNMWESVASSFLIMQSAIIDNMRKISKPDIYIKPPIKNVQLLNFDKYKEIMRGVRYDVDQFKIDLEKELNKKKFLWF